MHKVRLTVNPTGQSVEALCILSSHGSPTSLWAALKEAPVGLGLGTVTPAAPGGKATFTLVRRSEVARKKGLFAPGLTVGLGRRTAHRATTSSIRSPEAAISTRTSGSANSGNPYYLSGGKQKKSKKSSEQRESEIPIVVLDDLFGQKDAPTSRHEGQNRADSLLDEGDGEQPASETGAAVMVTSKRKSKVHKSKSKKGASK